MPALFLFKSLPCLFLVSSISHEYFFHVSSEILPCLPISASSHNWVGHPGCNQKEQERHRKFPDVSNCSLLTWAYCLLERSMRAISAMYTLLQTPKDLWPEEVQINNQHQGLSLMVSLGIVLVSKSPMMLDLLYIAFTSRWFYLHHILGFIWIWPWKGWPWLQLREWREGNVWIGPFPGNEYPVSVKDLSRSNRKLPSALRWR